MYIYRNERGRQTVGCQRRSVSLIGRVTEGQGGSQTAAKSVAVARFYRAARRFQNANEKQVNHFRVKKQTATRVHGRTHACTRIWAVKCHVLQPERE